jgi:hypothetical protein
MSRLDFQVLAVRNKLALGLFLEGWAIAAFGLAVVLLATIVGQRVLDRSLPHAWLIFWIAVLATAAGGFIYSVIRRPSEEFAAVKIDQALGLKEKISTAIYARPLHDPFAKAAVLDAEIAARTLSAAGHFPVAIPRYLYPTLGVFLLALLAAEFFPSFHVHPKPPLASAKEAPNLAKPNQDLFAKQALTTILAPVALPNSSDVIRKAGEDLSKAVQTDEGDQLHNHRSVLAALQNYNKAMAEELDKNEKFQTSQNTMNQMASIESAKDDSTPVGKAQNELKDGNLDAAMNDIAKAVNNFDKASDQEQQKMLDQAKNLANSLAKAANDPKVNQKIAEQLMQMGATQSQAQNMAATMQQAAQGNKAAQQQMQQMAQQMAQQLNNGQGPNQQQQKQIQSMMTKAQAMANSQAQAQALSQAAQQLSVAMAQAHGASQHSASQGQTGKAGQGQQGGQSGQSNMAGAQQMQQQMQQMQASAKDAQAMQAAANAAAQAAADAASGLGTPSGGSGDADAMADNSGGQGQNPQQQGKPGNGGMQRGWDPNPGKGGVRMGIETSPVTFKQEVDTSRDIASGKLLASRYVKAGIDPGKSSAGLKDIAAAAEKDAPDEIEQDQVPREAQQAEKDYFSAMQNQDGQ